MSLSAEVYLLPSLIDSGPIRYLPAEWLTSLRWQPQRETALSFGLGGGSGLPFSDESGGASLAVGVPSFRALLFARYATSAD